MVSVKNVMRAKVVTADPNTSLYKISKILSNNQIGSVVIIDKKKPVGIVTERDVVLAVASKKNLEKIKVKDLKKKALVYLQPSEDLLEAARKMTKNGFKRLPVVDKGKLVGILTEKEVLLTAPELIDVLAEKLRDRVERIADTSEAISGACEKYGDYSDDLRHEEGRWYCEDCRNEEGEEDEGEY